MRAPLRTVSGSPQLLGFLDVTPLVFKDVLGAPSLKFRSLKAGGPDVGCEPFNPQREVLNFALWSRRGQGMFIARLCLSLSYCTCTSKWPFSHFLRRGSCLASFRVFSRGNGSICSCRLSVSVGGTVPSWTTSGPTLSCVVSAGPEAL